MASKKNTKKVKDGDFKELNYDDNDKSSKSRKSKHHDSVKKLYRSKNDKMIAGVCGGIGDYLNIDSIWIRLVCLILVFMDGVGLIAYIILWVLMPENPFQKDGGKTIVEEKVSEVSEKIHEGRMKKKHSSSYVGGLFLIAVGGIFLLDNILPNNIWDYAWPVLIIALGVGLLIKNKGNN